MASSYSQGTRHRRPVHLCRDPVSVDDLYLTKCAARVRAHQCPSQASLLFTLNGDHLRIAEMPQATESATPVVWVRSAIYP